MSGREKTIFRGLCGAVVVLACAGSLAAVPIADLYNSGVDDDNVILPGGVVDTHWLLTDSPDPLYPGPDAFVVESSAPPLEPGGWLPNSSESQWISPRTDGGHNFPRTDDCGPGNTGPCDNANYAYETTFDLTGLDPLTAVIAGRWATDDAGTMILLNGVDTGISYPFVPGVNWREWSDFIIDSGFVAGVNTLTVVVRNGYFDDGNRDNATGLRIEVCGTADVPEPVSTMALFALGSTVILRRFRRR